MSKLFHIKNENGEYYVGTTDHNPIFGNFESRSRFSEEAAQKRVRGLQRGGGKFEIVPEDAGRPSE